MRTRSALALFGVLLFPCSLCTGDEAWFVRGNTNADELVDISDAIETLGYLFLGNDTPTCLDAADANDDGEINIVDPIYLLDHLFRGGPAPPFPGLLYSGGPDPTADALTCRRAPFAALPIAGTLHVGGVEALTAFPDGGRLAFGGGALGVLDVESGRVLWSVREPGERLHTVAVSPDATVVAAGSLGLGAITLRDASTGKLLRILDVGEEHPGAPDRVEFSPDGARLLSVSGGHAWLWNLRSDRPAPTLVSGDLEATMASFVSGGTRILVAGIPEPWIETRVVLVDAESLSVLESSPLPSPEFRIAVSPDGTRFVVVDDMGSFVLWTVAPWEPLFSRTFALGYDAPSLTFSRDSDRLILVDEVVGGPWIHVLDARTGDVTDRLWQSGDALCVTASADPSHFYCASRSGPITDWDLTTGESRNLVEDFTSMHLLSSSFPTWYSTPDCVAEISPDGALVAVGASWDDPVPGDAPIHFRDATTGTLLRKARAPLFAPLSGLGVRPGTGELFVCRGAPDAALYLWDPASWSISRRLPVGPGALCAMSADGESVVVGDESGVILRYSLLTGAEESRAYIPSRYPLALWSSGGSVKALMLEGDDGADGTPVVGVWDGVSGMRTCVLDVEYRYPIAAVFTPDGAGIVVRDRYSNVHLWDTETGASLAEFGDYYHEDRPTLALSPDGQMLFLGAPERIEAYRLADGLWLRNYDAGAPGGYRAPLRVSPDGSRIAMLRGSLIVWDTGTGEVVAHVDPPIGAWNLAVELTFLDDPTRVVCAGVEGALALVDLETETWGETFTHGEIGNVDALAFSPSGDRLASAHHFYAEGEEPFPDLQAPVEFQLVIWDVAEGTPVRVEREHEARIRDIAYSRDGQRIASADVRGTVVLRDGEGAFLEAFLPLGSPLSLTAVEFSATGDLLLVGAHEPFVGARIVVWDLAAAAPIRELTVPDAVICVFSPETMTAVAGRSVVDLETGETRGVISTRELKPIVLVPRTSLVLGIDSGDSTWLYDTGTGEPVQKVLGYAVRAAAAYPDGSTVLAVTGTRIDAWRVPDWAR